MEEGFRDVKRLLGLERIMNKKREQMEQRIALVLLADAIGLLVGEALLRSLHLAEAQGGVAS